MSSKNGVVLGIDFSELDPITKASGEMVVEQVIRAIGDDPDREGLKGTPERVVRSWKELYGGYNKDIGEILSAQFTESSAPESIHSYDEMVILKDIEFYSTCEHHLLPFFGKAHVAYIPNETIVGISKLARLVDAFSRRVQIQERITNQIADALMEHLDARGCGVVMEAQHLCMVSRGVQKQNSVMTTSAIRGVFWKPEARAEFYAMTRA